LRHFVPKNMIILPHALDKHREGTQKGRCVFRSWSKTMARAPRTQPQVRTRLFAMPLYTKMHRFTKTGAGQP
jgi:hypothetical protein